MGEHHLPDELRRHGVKGPGRRGEKRIERARVRVLGARELAFLSARRRAKKSARKSGKKLGRGAQLRRLALARRGERGS